MVGAFGGGAGVEQVADGRAEFLLGAGDGLVQERFEPGEQLFDRIEVGRVRRRYMIETPVAEIAWRTPSILCAARLSSTTMSPGASAGASHCYVGAASRVDPLHQLNRVR
jgi:hypothetical protein